MHRSPIRLRARRRAFPGLAALAAIALAAPAGAVPLTFEFAGTVDTLTADRGLFGAGVQVGDPFTGRFSYEVGPGNPDQEPGDPLFGVYALTSFEVDQAAVALTPERIVVGRREPQSTLPPAPPDPGWDRLLVQAEAAEYARVTLLLQAPFGAVFADDALPTSLALADFPDGAALQGLVAAGLPPSPSIEDTGRITSLVPEPGTASLLAAGLALLGARRRPAAAPDQTRPA